MHLGLSPWPSAFHADASVKLLTCVDSPQSGFYMSYCFASQLLMLSLNQMFHAKMWGFLAYCPGLFAPHH